MLAPFDGRQLGQLADVGAGDERLLPRPGEDQAAQVGRGLRAGNRGGELLLDGRIQRVQFLGTVHRDDTDSLGGLDADGLAAHRFSPYS
jgi:hypothetical protein